MSRLSDNVVVKERTPGTSESFSINVLQHTAPNSDLYKDDSWMFHDHQAEVIDDLSIHCMIDGKIQVRGSKVTGHIQLDKAIMEQLVLEYVKKNAGYLSNHFKTQMATIDLTLEKDHA